MNVEVPSIADVNVPVGLGLNVRDALNVEVPSIADVDVPAVGLALNARTSGEDVCGKVSATLESVKKHTAVINATISSVKDISHTSEVSVTIKGEVVAIVQIVADLCAELSVVLGESTELVGEVKDELVSLVLSLLFEILFTLHGVVVTLKICKCSPQDMYALHPTNFAQPSSSSSDRLLLLCSQLFLTCSLSLTLSLLTF